MVFISREFETTPHHLLMNQGLEHAWKCQDLGARQISVSSQMADTKLELQVLNITICNLACENARGLWWHDDSDSLGVLILVQPQRGFHYLSELGFPAIVCLGWTKWGFLESRNPHATSEAHARQLGCPGTLYCAAKTNCRLLRAIVRYSWSWMQEANSYWGVLKTEPRSERKV